MAEERKLGSSSSRFPVVGIGASAGGIDSAIRLLERLPAHTGMAFVIVFHLAREHPSSMVEVLGKSTTMPVRFVADDVLLEPDNVYIIPPDAFLAVFHGRLRLMRYEEGPGPRVTIDSFFRSLAEDQRDQAVGVVLSGTGSDGAVGIRAIKVEGGITMAEDPASAAHTGMPQAAIATELVDFVLSPEEMADRLVEVSERLASRAGDHVADEQGRGSGQAALSKVFLLLRQMSGVDFSDYKASTMHRRIGVRMVVHEIERVEDYADYLERHPEEIEILGEELLINVTEFFRDPETFAAIEQKVMPELLKGRSATEGIRIWVPGCSTGEEPYSLAILVAEQVEAARLELPVQIFATDLSQNAIERARLGVYGQEALQGVSPERVRRFFQVTSKGLRVTDSIRDTVVFARHDVTRDPPFSHVDLISCRNLLIYLGVQLQQRLIPLFHFALEPSGFLVLGAAEDVREHRELFSSVDSEHSIYVKNPAARRPRMHPEPTGPGEWAAPPGDVRLVDRGAGETERVRERAARMAQERFMPPGVLIDEGLGVLEFKGDTSPYLRIPPGRPSTRLDELAREGLVAAVRAGIQQAEREGSTVVVPEVTVSSDGDETVVDLEVVPIGIPGEVRFYLVFFLQAQLEAEAAEPQPGGEPDPHELRRLRRELERTKEQLSLTIMEKQASVEQLRAANEEVQSGNEELQTAKEELQSTNEELKLVNEELQTRNAQLLRANDDLSNILTSASIPMIIVGMDRRIRRYTPQAEEILNLSQEDVGRLIGQVDLGQTTQDLDEMIDRTLRELATVEREFVDLSGRYYSLQVRPYRTADDRIEGVVLAFVDVDDLKRSVEDAESGRVRLAALVEATSDVLYSMSPDWAEMRQLQNKGFLANTDSPNRDWLEQYVPDGERERVRAATKEAIEDKKIFELEHQVVRADGGIGRAFSRAVPIFDESGEITEWFGAASDITQRRGAEDEL